MQHRTASRVVRCECTSLLCATRQLGNVPVVKAAACHVADRAQCKLHRMLHNVSSRAGLSHANICQPMVHTCMFTLSLRTLDICCR